MGRPKKQGNDFFPLSVDFFTDRKIKVLKANWGNDGVSAYVYMLCTIYKEGYYTKPDVDYVENMADDLNISVCKADQIFKFVRDRGLLDKILYLEYGILTSKAVQERFQNMVEGRARKNPIKVKKEYWLLSEEDTEPYIQFYGTSKNTAYCESEAQDPALRTERKHFEEENLQCAFMNYLEVRRANGDKITPAQEDMLVAHLQELSQDPEKQLLMIKKATMGNWKTFYLPVEKKETKQKKQSGYQSKVGQNNKFNNFDQRDNTEVFAQLEARMFQ